MAIDTAQPLLIIILYNIHKTLKYFITMKKIVIFIVALFSLSQVDAYSNANHDSHPDDIYIYEMVNGSGDSFRSRSIGPAVSARVNHDMGQIEIAFSEYLGVATIRVVDGMGMTISAYRCDTETEWDAYLPIPVDAGAYKLIIDSSVAEYIGEFFIQ